MKTALLALPLISVPLLLTACPGNNPPPVACVVQSVTVTPGSVSLSNGQTQQLTVTPVLGPSGCAGSPDTTATWSSSNPASATVSGGGLVTAVAAGSSTVTATVGGQSGSAVVSVGAICAQSLGLAALGTPDAGVIQVRTPAPDWSAAHVPGQVLVVRAAGSALSAQGLGALAAVRTESVTPQVTLAFTPAGEDDRAFARRLEAAGLTVQPNFRYQALATPNDPGFPGNGGIMVGGGKVTQTYLTRVRAPEAWDFLSTCGKTPAAAKTAVLDTATETTHTDLAGRADTLVSFLASTAARTYVHGTATSGLIAAQTNNAKGLAGVTWNGSVLPIEVLDSTGGSTSDIVKGLNYAVTQGAKVVNMSLGGPLLSASDPGDTALNDAIAAAAGSAVLVAAAGNTPNEGVYYPASNPNVIAVGAVAASDGALACYSARPNATLTRPLDIVAPGGVGNCAGATNADQMLVLAPSSSYDLGAGTSYAAPLVSGVAALVRAANPNLTAGQTKNLLLTNVNSAAGLPLLDANAAVRAATK